MSRRRAPEYRTVVRQRIPEILLGRIEPGVTRIANAQGVPLYAFETTVIPSGGGDPFPAKTGMPTPPAALPLVFPGSRVPVRYLPENRDAVVIDWAAAGVD